MKVLITIFKQPVSKGSVNANWCSLPMPIQNLKYVCHQEFNRMFMQFYVGVVLSHICISLNLITTVVSRFSG